VKDNTVEDSINIITLCTPTYNRKDDVRQFIDSINNLDKNGHNFDLMVIDDASTDGTSEYVREYHPDAILISLPENVGPARARNMAINHCQTPYIAFFDSDAVPHEDWFVNAIKYLEENTIIAGKVLRPDSSVEWGPRRAAFWGGSHPTTIERANAGSSCNMIVPIKLAKRTGGFREDFFVYFEDTEFCIRARVMAGGEVRYADDLRVVHHHHSMNTPARERLFWRNKIVGMLDLYQNSFKRLAFLAVSFLVLFQHLTRPRTFLASLQGFGQGLMMWLKRKDRHKSF